MLPDFLTSIVNYLLVIINEFGYFGVFIGMTIESSFFPFPSEVILVPAGALAAQGQMNMLAIFIAGLGGSLAGALFNYALALFLGRATIDFLVDKYGKFCFLKQKDIEKSDLFFQKHGEITTFIGRLIPVIRQLISLPAGFSKMKLFKFCLFTGLGAGIWTLILIYLGYFFGTNAEWISQNKNILSLLLVFFSMTTILFYVLKKRKKSK